MANAFRIKGFRTQTSEGYELTWEYNNVSELSCHSRDAIRQGLPTIAATVRQSDETEIEHNGRPPSIW